MSSSKADYYCFTALSNALSVISYQVFWERNFMMTFPWIVKNHLSENSLIMLMHMKTISLCSKVNLAWIGTKVNIIKDVENQIRNPPVIPMQAMDLDQKVL